MSKILKNVLFSVGTLAFVFVLVGALSTNKAEAATCTASAGDWMTPGTWSCARVPLAGDDVVIPTNVVVTLSTAGAVANTISFDAAAATSGITMASPATLTVTGAITIPATTAGTVVTTFAVAGGTLTAGGVITITGSATDDRDSVLSATSGTINANGGITFAGTAAEAQVTVGSGGTLNFGGTTGTLGTGGTLSLNAASTTTFTGTGAQAINDYTYGHLTINKSSGTATMLAGGTIPVAGNLTVTAGTLAMGTSIPTVTGTTTVASGATLTMSTGTKTFNGNVTLNSGVTLPTATVTIGGTATLNVAAGILDTAGATFSVAGATTIASGATLTISSATGSKTFTGLVTNNGTWTETADEEVTFAGGLTNAGTFTAYATTPSAVHDFTGTAKTITGTLSIPNLTITGTTTNVGTLTVSTALAGASTLTNTGTLNYGGSSITPTLTANSAGTVNYNASGAQTVKATNYYNLTFSGSGAKSLSGARAVAGNMIISAGTANLDNTITVTGTLKLGTVWQVASSYGFTGSGATHINTTYFSTGTGKVVSSASYGTSTSTGPTITTNPTPVVAQSPVPITVEVAPGVTETTMSPGCSGGNVYNTSTGALCVNNAGSEIPGCGNRNTGFSTASGASCSGNRVISVPVTITYNFGTTTLKNGSRGNAVMELQRFLNTKLNFGLVVDGKLGPKTIAVIKQWQRDHSLVADGLIGAKTKAKMNAEAN